MGKETMDALHRDNCPIPYTVFSKYRARRDKPKAYLLPIFYLDVYAGLALESILVMAEGKMQQ